MSRSCPSADEPLPELQARAYAHACAAMRHSEGDAIAQQGAFQDGVTRGATWYPVLGSMQVGGGATRCLLIHSYQMSLMGRVA